MITGLYAAIADSLPILCITYLFSDLSFRLARGRPA